VSVDEQYTFLMEIEAGITKVIIAAYLLVIIIRVSINESGNHYK